LIAALKKSGKINGDRTPREPAAEPHRGRPREGASGSGNPKAPCQRRSFLVGQFGNDKTMMEPVAMGRIE
jgi:hypothetical protein